MSPRFFPILVLIAGLAPAAPGHACAPTPEAAARTYAEAAGRCDWAKAWTLLSSEDRAAASSAAAWTQEAMAQALRDFACRQRVDSVRVTRHDGITATAELVVREPLAAAELRALWLELELRRPSLAEPVRARVIETAASLLTTSAGPEASAIVEFTVRREGGGWCVHLGEAERLAEDAERRERAAAERERREAEERARSEAERQAKERGAAALPGLSVVALRVADSDRGGKGVFGEVVNASPETIRALTLRIGYLDRDGNVATETDHQLMTAGRDGRISWQGRDVPPLRPGQRRRFGLPLDDAPSTWSGRVVATVVAAEAVPPAP